MWRRGGIGLAAVVFAVAPAEAQSFKQLTGTYVFGDSTVDSGWWQGAYTTPASCAGNPAPCTSSPTNSLKNNALIAALAAGANGAPVGANGLMNSQLLAGYFGLTANPVNQPGGTNYAISGAVDNVTGAGVSPGPGFGNLNPNTNLPSTVQQVANYLAANGGVANPNGLYYVSSGGNDATYAKTNYLTGGSLNSTGKAFLTSEATAEVNALVRLQAAGARYLIVNNETNAFNALHRNTVWNGLAAAGVNFVPVDTPGLVSYIQANPTLFGFTSATVNQAAAPAAGATSTGSACVWTGKQGTTGVLNSGWGQWCVNTTTPNANYAYLASANAQQTYLYSDDQHFSAAGQKIQADFIYSLLVAPSQISMLAENAIKTRTSLVSGIQRQIEATQGNTGASRVNAWVTGDISSLKIDNYPGFPNDPSTTLSLTGGVSYTLAPGLLVGTAVSVGHNKPSWDGNRGGFTQDEVTGSLYAAIDQAGFWGSVVGTYGKLSYDVNRNVPLGIAVLSNSASTSGRNLSVGGLAGYDFSFGSIKTGPVAGILWQHTKVDGFTETGDVTALGFMDQTRNSAVSSLGWRAKMSLGAWQPFAQVVWNHELASTDRNVTAFLTSVAAPSYYMPAVAVGQDWGTATLGTTWKLSEGIVALGSVQSEFGDHGVRSYGGQVGLNVRF